MTFLWLLPGSLGRVVLFADAFEAYLNSPAVRITTGVPGADAKTGLNRYSPGRLGPMVTGI